MKVVCGFGFFFFPKTEASILLDSLYLYMLNFLTSALIKW